MQLRTESPETRVQIVLKMAEFEETLDEIKTLLKEYEVRLPEDKISPPLRYLVATLKIVTDDIEGADRSLRGYLKKHPRR